MSSISLSRSRLNVVFFGKKTPLWPLIVFVVAALVVVRALFEHLLVNGHSDESPKELASLNASLARNASSSSATQLPVLRRESDYRPSLEVQRATTDSFLDGPIARGTHTSVGTSVSTSSATQSLRGAATALAQPQALKPLYPTNDDAADELLRVEPMPACEAVVKGTLTPHWINKSYASDFAARPADTSKTRTRPVAMCLSGGLRTFRKLQGAIYKTLVAPNDADVFMFVSVDEADMPSSIELLSSLPWVKAFVIEDETWPVPELRQWSTACGDRTFLLAKKLPMFRKIYMCDQLARDYESTYGIRYENYVRWRPDMLLGYFDTVNFTSCPDGAICVPRRKSLDLISYFSIGCRPRFRAVVRT
eukprot:TRINITY_DN5847_c0_g1_i1.p1 TRINITY_DN5847_c0_g1~~TRINITY_DN5847_c0_g1_i1.p1  ORF type:complete len:364 (-),score=58.72 TRINITY_DN5847_c0_g1_i1:519-1610(-)